MNRHKTGEADGMNLEVDSKDGVDAYLNEWSVIFNDRWLAGEKGATGTARVKSHCPLERSPYPKTNPNPTDPSYGMVC